MSTFDKSLAEDRLKALWNKALDLRIAGAVPSARKESLLEGIELAEDSQEYLFLARFLSERSMDLVKEYKFKEAIRLAARSFWIARSLQGDEALARAHIAACYARDRSNHFKKGIPHIFKALKHAKESEEQTLILTSLKFSGISYFHLGDFPKAIEVYFKSLKIAERISNHELGSLHNNIALCYWSMKMHDVAENHLKLAIHNHRTHEIKENAITPILNLGELYIEAKKFDQAKVTLRQAEALLKESSKLRNKIFLKTCQSKLLLELKDFDQAKKAVDEIEKLLSEVDFPISMAPIYQQKFTIAASEENFTEAIKWAEKALESVKTEELDRQYEVLTQVADVYEKGGQPEKAYSLLKRAVSLKETYDSKEKHRQLQNLYITREVERRERKIGALTRSKEIAEKISEAKSELIAVISHDLKTPLNAIMALTDLMLESDLDEEHKEHLKLIHDAGDLQLALINDILDFSKLEAGSLILDPQKVIIRDLIEESFNLFRSQFLNSGINFSTLIDDSVPEEGNFDPTRFKQIVINLLGNALRYTGEGSVIFEAKLNQTGLLEVSVEDTGPGIDPEFQEKIFGKFSQISDKQGLYKEGSGLGLNIVKQLSEKMGGSVRLESELNRGSKFTFEIKIK